MAHADPLAFERERFAGQERELLRRAAEREHVLRQKGREQIRQQHQAQHERDRQAYRDSPIARRIRFGNLRELLRKPGVREERAQQRAKKQARARSARTYDEMVARVIQREREASEAYQRRPLQRVKRALKRLGQRLNPSRGAQRARAEERERSAALERARNEVRVRQQAREKARQREKEFSRTRERAAELMTQRRRQKSRGQRAR